MQDDDVDEKQADEDEREVDEELLQVAFGLRVHLHDGRPAYGRAGDVLNSLHRELQRITDERTGGEEIAQGTEPRYRQLLALTPVFHRSRKTREDDRAILSRCERRLKAQSDDKI
ncbi:hypothetical protein KOW79_007905 [Hemibagrus wyckioides]|uniref:Uncharacterized protein n=1 Tax=Hemibagrus wyckioides TaxID=337641 RepID=A0A9D3NSV3_9TELE|nr:hypothetical protein KOW79_007905 [Hemibagrus wyckioides]